jgi:hypothetical protein
MLRQTPRSGLGRRFLELLHLFGGQHIREIEQDSSAAFRSVWLLFAHGVSCVTAIRLLRDAQRRKKKLCITQNIFYGAAVTDEQDIRNALASASKNRGDISRIAKALSIAPSTVKRWNDGGEIPPPMLKLLNLYFFDKMPFDITGENLLPSMFDFTEDQWKVICVLAGRLGITPGVWISNQIRTYLAGDDKAMTLRKELEAARRASSVGLTQLFEMQKVAEDPTPYGHSNGKTGNG